MGQIWSIGLYVGSSPTKLSCPADLRAGILHASDVSDMTAAFVADPFMSQWNECFYLFFEVFDAVSRSGAIGLAKSFDLRKWTYEKIVLKEPFHLSYPHVFLADGEHYMVLETLQRKCISLYKARHFPTEWSYLGPLVRGEFADPSIFRHLDRWWLFVCGTPYQHDMLRLFSAEQLRGPWIEHPSSPLILRDARRARPAGRVVTYDGKLIRFAQDCFPAYGTHVRAFSIDILDEHRYFEHELPESPIFGPGVETWNRDGMHHVDLHYVSSGLWVACVDGHTNTERK